MIGFGIKQNNADQIIPIWQLTTGVFILLLFWVGGCTAAPAVGNGRIAYLNWDENGRVQLYAFNLTTKTTEQLTAAPADIHSYAVSPDETQIVYSIPFADGRSELWQLNLNERRTASTPTKLFTCENAQCIFPIWAPDSRRLIYERRELVDGSLGLPSLWWLDVETGETTTVLAEDKPPNQAAALSPDGSWLSYASPADEGVLVYNFENGRFFRIPSQLDTRAAWKPDSSQLVVSDFNVVILHGGEETDHLAHEHDAVQSIHLFVTGVADEQRRQLTQGSSVDDSTPVWSPDGQWIAFGRKLLGTNTGRQLWLVRADGSEEVPLTDELAIHHGVPSWREDGRLLLYQHFDITTPDTPPSIWTIDIQTQTQQQIVPIGFQPVWLH